MNRIKIIVWLTIFLIIFCSGTLICTWYTKKQMHQIVDKALAVSISDTSSQEDIKRIKPMLEKIETQWSKYEPIVDTYSRHNDVERVTEEIERIRPLYDNGQYTQLNIKLAGINEALDHLMKNETPSIANIL